MSLIQGMRLDRMFLIALIAIQIAIAGFYLVDFGLDVSGIRKLPVSWEYRELVQGITLAGMVLSVVISLILLRNQLRRSGQIRASMQAASGAFHALMQQRFDEWGLTPSEREVATLTIKGFSIEETAAIRGKSAGTVKSQSNAVFRKAGVRSRAQLVSLFIEDLTAELPEPGP